MADILDQIRADEAAIERQSLEVARTENRWASTFNSIPPVEALRASRNLTAQVNSAVERRQKLAAETDQNAQQLYLRQKAFDAEMELQPLKVANMEAQIEREKALTAATGLAERNRQADEIADLNDVAEFTAEISELDSTSPDYMKLLSQAAVRHPRAITTTSGLAIFKEKSKRHQSIDELRKQLNDDEEVESISVDESGGVRVTARPKQPSFATPDEARAHFGADATIRQNAKGQWSATIRPDKDFTLPETVKTRFADIEGKIAEQQALLESPDAIVDPAVKAKLAGFQKEREKLLSFHPELAGAPAPAAANVASTDPKIALAQRAIDDPNASEAHKAAARRILGVQ